MLPYLNLLAIAVEAHPTLICDLSDLRQVLIFKLIQADVMGQPGERRRVEGDWEGGGIE